MIAYRLVHRLALEQRPHPLTSSGALGRWNSSGVYITYLAEHPALAALELLNYAGQYRNMSGYRLFRVEVPEAFIQDVDSSVDVKDYGQTRPHGTAWVRSGRSLGLRVSSVTAPLSVNLLLNQRHPNFPQLSAEDLGEFVYDARVTALFESAPGATPEKG
jgi:RES domain-containing protein